MRQEGQSGSKQVISGCNGGAGRPLATLLLECTAVSSFFPEETVRSGIASRQGDLPHGDAYGEGDRRHSEISTCTVGRAKLMDRGYAACMAVGHHTADYRRQHQRSECDADASTPETPVKKKEPLRSGSASRQGGVYRMARTTVEQTDDAAGGRLRLVEQGLARRGYAFSCMAATAQRTIRDNTQGNIRGANAMWTTSHASPCAAGTRASSHYPWSNKCRAPVPYQVLACVYIEPTRAPGAAMRKRKTRKEEVVPVNSLSPTGQGHGQNWGPLL
ncbi:hypothetical protein MTO96_021324 [Rhipicephalus appendiculatus]